MHAHRTRSDVRPAALQPSATPSAGSVRGLGICDALFVELQPRQVSACVDEIEALARVLKVALASGSDDSERERYELRVLGGALSRLLEPVDRDNPVLLGPAPLVSQIVAGAASEAVTQLHETVDANRGADERARTELRRLSDDAAAWMDTYLDALAVQWFCFDPDFSPVH
jgi:hypothetical protein